jgi:hypothetical protein
MKMNYRRKNPAPSAHKPHISDFHIYYSERFIDGSSLTTNIDSNDFVCGQHGAARSKRGAKHAITTARRRAHKRFIADALAYEET